MKFDAYQSSSVQGRLYLINRLENAFNRLIRHQESLRTCFLNREGKVLQLVYEHIPFKLDFVCYFETEVPELIADFFQPFDLDRVPLWRVRLVRTDPDRDRYLLLFDIHHIIADGTVEFEAPQEMAVKLRRLAGRKCIFCRIHRRGNRQCVCRL